MTTGKKGTQQNSKNDYVGDETILKVAKEVAIKFIEMGRITPASFDSTFKGIHKSVSDTVKKEE